MQSIHTKPSKPLVQPSFPERPRHEDPLQHLRHHLQCHRAAKVNIHHHLCVVGKFNLKKNYFSITPRLVGLRVNQIYDIDNRTYLIRFQEKDTKCVLLLESGNRFHTTAFEWPKNMAPSGFSMKLRKHLKNKRLERFVQLELDRIVDLQFGMGEAAYHVIVELYDRGNIILTDHEMTILNILRPHVEGEEELRFAVREKYPESRAKEQSTPRSLNELRTVLERGRPGDNLKKVLNPVLGYGPAIIDHILTKHELNNVKLAEPIADFVVEQEVEIVVEGDEEIVVEKLPPKGKKGKQPKAKAPPKAQKKEDTNTRWFDYDRDLPTLLAAIEDAEQIMNAAQTQPSKGYIIQKRELRPGTVAEGALDVDYVLLNQEYHPYLFAQHAQLLYKEFASFDAAVDEFYSTSESQKIDVKTMQQERDALKKLSNVKRDHEKRLDDLGKWQVFDKNKAELITRNQTLVDNAILAIRSAIASQLPWPEIQALVKGAQTNRDPVASTIKQLKLETNHITLLLSDPYAANADEEDEKLEPTLIDIDLAMSAYANATRYYDKKRMAAKKQQRTIESSTKAYKSAERKTQQSLKEMRNISTISKARKVFWFEKFYWFISSENYLIIGGRDQQQNELIVKRYMRATDIYVHAEIQGASSVVIRNASGKDVPPKTLLEAGTMAISYSVAWDAKVVTNAYWVRSSQVSKTAPTGEYLGTGSFMIRGKKNFLPPCHLILGMSFMFRLEESSVERHRGERKVRSFEEEEAAAAAAAASGIEQKLNKVHIENEQLPEVLEEEIELLDSDDDPDPPPPPADNDDSADDDDDENQFPDTHVKIEHDTGRVALQSDPALMRRQSEVVDDIIFMGDNQPFIIHTGQQSKVKQQKRDRDQRKGKKAVVVVAAAAADEKSDENERKSMQPKRGQKGKLKKIREKYKDQDEEEKRIRMDILKSAGSGKTAAAAAAAAAKKEALKLDETEEDKAAKKPEFKPRPVVAAAAADDEQDDVVDDTPTTAAGDIEMLDSLTGCPMDEDELLFAVPVIAPYQAMQNYKYVI